MDENQATPAEQETGYSEDAAAQEILTRMLGKQNAQAEESEQESPESEPETETEAQDADEAQPEAEAKEPEAETEWEIEFGGQVRKLKGVPEEVAREVQEFGKNLHADYTRKTQEISEIRKAVEAERAQMQELLRLSHEHADLVADWRVVQRQMDQLSQTDWDALSESDPITAQKSMARLMQLQQAQQRIGAQLQSTVQDMTTKQQEAAKAKLAEAEADVRKSIPQWGPDMAKALRDYGKSLGFNEAELSQVTDPRVVKLLHKAQQFDTLQRSKPAVTKKVSEVSKTLKPNAATTPQTQKRAQVDDAMKRLSRTGSRQDAEAVLLARLGR